MTTLADVRTACRLTIAAASIENDDLDAWIGEALRFHSVQFPRRARVDLDCTTGTQEYPLPDDVGDIYRVLEVGLIQASEVHPLPLVTPLSPRMFGGGRYCAVVTTAIEDTSGEFAILVAEPVATGDVLQVTVACSWPIPTVGSDDDVVLVPAGHIEALIAFVEFRVHWALETNEAFAVSTVSVVLSQLGENARRAWNRYKEVTDQLQWLMPAPSGRVVWGKIGL
jgi:hypothetical protein